MAHLIRVKRFHGLHDYSDVDFSLDLKVETGLVHGTLLLRAENLLAFELPNVDYEAQLRYLLIELLSMHD